MIVHVTKMACVHVLESKVLVCVVLTVHVVPMDNVNVPLIAHVTKMETVLVQTMQMACVCVALAAHVEQACMELMEPAVVVLMEPAVVVLMEPAVCVDKCHTVRLQVIA
jgi:hypothetical protein